MKRYNRETWRHEDMKSVVGMKFGKEEKPEKPVNIKTLLHRDLISGPLT